MKKELIILGATGSIGQQTLQVIKNSDYQVKSITVGKNIDKAIEIIQSNDIKYVATIEEDDALKLKEKFPYLNVGFGEQGIEKALEYNGDVVNAITGIAGLVPTVKAIKKGKNILLANKETLVVGGNLITELAKTNNVKIIPVDSEHNAVYQLIKETKKEEIKRIIITASGGAFRDYKRDELNDVKLVDALGHPNWSMGNKITIDCATMVNKGLEVIEAHYLFGLDYEKITTIIHPESIIHAMVEYNDNSLKALLYNPSMIIPIQNAIFGTLHSSSVKPVDFDTLSKLTFRKMDFKRFPMLELAYYVGKTGGLLPTVYNASNEKAVELFMQGKIKFLQIEEIIKNAVMNFENNKNDITIEDIIETDKFIKDNIKY